MPAVSKKQQRFMGAELARKREGKKTKTKMTEKQLEEFASTKRKGLPSKAPKDHSKENAMERKKMMGMEKEMHKKKTHSKKLR